MELCVENFRQSSQSFQTVFIPRIVVRNNKRLLTADQPGALHSKLVLVSILCLDKSQSGLEPRNYNNTCLGDES